MRALIGIGIGILIARWFYVKGGKKIVEDISTIKDPIETLATNEWSPRNKDVWQN